MCWSTTAVRAMHRSRCRHSQTCYATRSSCRSSESAPCPLLSSAGILTPDPTWFIGDRAGRSPKTRRPLHCTTAVTATSSHCFSSLSVSIDGRSTIPHTTHTQSPVRIEEQFCWRRAEVVVDKEAGIRREGGGELLHRGFSIQRSHHVHNEAVASCFETSRSSACTLGVTWLSACGTPSPWMTLSSKIRRDRDRDAGSSFTIASPHGDGN